MLSGRNGPESEILIFGDTQNSTGQGWIRDLQSLFWPKSFSDSVQTCSGWGVP